MTPSSTFLFIGDHPETIDSGRRLSLGDEIPGADLGDGKIAKRLIENGQLVQSRSETDKERAARNKQQRATGQQAEGDAAADAATSADADQGDGDSPPRDETAAPAADSPSKETN